MTPRRAGWWIDWMWRARFVLAVAVGVLWAFASRAQDAECPAAGARFERNGNLMTATGGAGDRPGWCPFRAPTGQVWMSTLKSDDKPLDPVPRGGPGCPAGGVAEYKWMVTVHRATIQRGPDAAGRCELRHEDGRVMWMRPDEFKTGAAQAAAAALAAPRPGSVYDCTLPGIGQFTGANFGIVDGSTYRNHDGGRGSYTYDPATRVLRLTSGPSRGMRYRQESERNFRVLDERGNTTGGNCALTPKRIDGRW